MNKRIRIGLVTATFLAISATYAGTGSTETTQPTTSIPIETLPPVEAEHPPEKVFTVRDLFAEFSSPLEDWIVTEPFGERKTTWGGIVDGFHRGVDLISTKKGAKILAAADGVIMVHYLPPGTIGDRVFKGHPTYGAMILIAHENGLYTLYAHMSKTFVREGMAVKRGDVIGIIGNTGVSTGVHLHFEILFDPMQAMF